MDEFTEQTLIDARAEIRIRILAKLHDEGTAQHFTETDIARIGAKHHTPGECRAALTELTDHYIEIGKGKTGEGVCFLTPLSRVRLQEMIAIEGSNPGSPINLLVLIRRALAKVDRGEFVPGECAALWGRMTQAV